ncbi:unnamed protein product [Closterium sp. Naga37s-1]|nr:unnamed protein product [Closterium sp. Naga37s-1]
MDDVSCDADSPPDSPPFRPPPSAAALADDDDEGETLLGVRAAFPASFGRQEERVTPLEAVHAQTARAHAERAGVKGKKKAGGMKFSIGSSLAKRLGDGAKAGLGGAAAVGVAGAGGVAEGGGAVRVAEGMGGEVAGEHNSREAGGNPLSGGAGGANGEAGRANGGGGGARAARGGGAADGRGAAVVRGDGEGHAVIGPPRPPGPLEDGGGGLIGPPAPATRGTQQPGGRKKGRAAGRQDEQRSDGSEEDDEEEGAEAEEEDEFGVPLSNEIVLGGHTKAVAALAVDPTGTRVISGSYDYSLRFYDFHGMDSSLNSFRQVLPCDGHQVRAVSFSPSADLFIVATGNAQAKVRRSLPLPSFTHANARSSFVRMMPQGDEDILRRLDTYFLSQVYDRDGRSKGEFVRGDMYIRDLRNTKGHIAGLTTAQWHPCERHSALTASDDGSLRIWDVRDFKSQTKVVKPKLARPGRVAVTAAEWGPDGRMVAAGLNDGSLQVWNVRTGWGSLPDLLCADAHQRGDDITGLAFCSDASLLVSRSMDGSMKVTWMAA